MTTPLKILLYATAVCVIVFCVTGVGFMFYHERQVTQQADDQRAAIEDQRHQCRRAVLTKPRSMFERPEFVDEELQSCGR